MATLDMQIGRFTKAIEARPAAPASLSAAEARIWVQDFSFYYGAFRALKAITLGFADRQITAIIGPSGCGKSTFLRSINRMNDLVPGVRIEGTVLVDQQNIYEPSVDPAAVRRQIGMVFQRPNPFPKSIFDNVAFGPRIHGLQRGAALADLVEQSLRQAALWDEVREKLKQPAYTLSGGQQQRLCIARALAMQPNILLMDEPASALDPVATLKIEELMLTLRERYTMIIVTHNMQQAARVADQAAFFMADEQRAGFLVETGPTATIFTTPTDQRTEDYITGRFG